MDYVLSTKFTEMQNTQKLNSSKELYLPNLIIPRYSIVVPYAIYSVIPSNNHNVIGTFTTIAILLNLSNLV